MCGTRYRRREHPKHRAEQGTGQNRDVGAPGADGAGKDGMTGLLWIVRVLALALALGLLMPGAWAQLPVPPADTYGEQATDQPPPAARALLSLLADPAVQDWLERELEDGPAPAETEAASFHAWLQGRLDQAAAHTAALVDAAAALPAEIAHAAVVWQVEMPADRTWGALFGVVVFVAIGVGVERLYWRVSGPLRRRLAEVPPAHRSAVLGRVGLRLLVDGLAVVTFALGSVGAFLAFDWPPITRLFILSFLTAFVIVRLVDAFASFLLAPYAPALRLVPVATPTAHAIHRWVRALAVVAAFGFMVCGAIAELGLLRQSHLLLVYAVGFLLAAMLVAAVWRCRRPVAAILARESAAAGHLPAALAELWPYVATLYIVLVLALWLIGATGPMATLLVLVGVPLADRVAKWVIELVMRRRPASAAPDAPVAAEAGLADGDAAPDADAAAAAPAEAEGEVSPYAPVVHRALRLVIVAVAVLAMAGAMGANLTALLNPESGQARFLNAAFDIVITVVLVDLLWQAVRVAIDRRLAGMAPAGPAGVHGAGVHESGGEGGGGEVGPQARLRTLLPLVRRFIFVVLAVMAVMIVLSSLGVDIGPLLAGAGVVGIAIGFGAQALVRDIVAGVFFLLDDAFRLGEYVEIGELRGTVEGISIRSLKLRHHRGMLHTVPFGEMRSLTNYSRDWVIMKLEFRVPFDTDLALVKRIVKDIGKDLLKDPTLGPGFIEPLKSQGVRRWEEFNMVVGVKFMARPGEQFLIRREAYQRIRDAFEAHGIHFASRDVMVRVSKDATAEEMEDAITGAAMAAVQGEPPQGQAPSKKSA